MLDGKISSWTPSIPSGIAAYTAMETPLGPLMIAVSTQGICRCVFGDDRGMFEEDLYRAGYHEVVVDDNAAQPACTMIDGYFAGQHRMLDIPVDLSQLGPFERDVLLATQAVPWGTTASYREIATRVGRPLAYRAAGNALSRNPVTLIIPCHRIIKSDGTLGGYGSGEGGGHIVKRFLLRLEGIAID